MGRGESWQTIAWQAGLRRLILVWSTRYGDFRRQVVLAAVEPR